MEGRASVAESSTLTNVGKLIYALNVSLDGYTESPAGSLDWTNVDEELHVWFNDRARELDASLYGRRMYETMAGYWPTAESDPDATPAEIDYARIWNATPKVVFSSTLDSVAANSRLVRSGSDVGEELARVRTEFHGDLDVGGSTLASAFIKRGLVDEYQLIVHPVVLGGGKPFFPELEAPIRLRLTETKTFESGVVYYGYSVMRAP